MDVYMENYKKANSADNAEIHRYKRPAEVLERLHEQSHGRRYRMGFFSRSSSELLMEVVDEDGETACLASGRSNGRDGLVAGWPKTSRRGKQERRHC
jgi:hypothetical protein